MVTSKLDYCNTPYGLPGSLLHNYNGVQNTAAILITRFQKHEHINPVLRNFQWLPVHKRISFKILLVALKALNGQFPVICPN